MDIHRNAAAVILHGDGPIFAKCSPRCDHSDPQALRRRSWSQDLAEEVVQTVDSGVADVPSGGLPNRLQTSNWLRSLAM